MLAIRWPLFLALLSVSCTRPRSERPSSHPNVASGHLAIEFATIPAADSTRIRRDAKEWSSNDDLDTVIVLLHETSDVQQVELQTEIYVRAIDWESNLQKVSEGGRWVTLGPTRLVLLDTAQTMGSAYRVAVLRPSLLESQARLDLGKDSAVTRCRVKIRTPDGDSAIRIIKLLPAI